MRFQALMGLLGLVCLSLPGQVGNDQKRGESLYRSNCAFCHGAAGEGGRGPTLRTGSLVHGTSAKSIRGVIQKGIPGTTMPAFRDFEERDLNTLAAFVSSLSQGAPKNEKSPGNAERGKLVYARSGCAGCHQIGDTGSVYGPDLNRVGGARSLKYLRDSLLDPGADISEGYQGVRVTTRQGSRVEGIRLNEDTFSVQLRGMDQQFRMFVKSEVKAVEPAEQSMMPAYRHLKANDLNDLLAYLLTLKGAAQQGGFVREAEGIR